MKFLSLYRETKKEKFNIVDSSITWDHYSLFLSLNLDIRKFTVEYGGRTIHIQLFICSWALIRWLALPPANFIYSDL